MGSEQPGVVAVTPFLLDTHSIKQRQNAPDARVGRTMRRTPAEQEAVLSTLKLKLLKVLRWAREHGYPWDKQDLECASGHHPETQAWVRAQPE